MLINLISILSNSQILDKFRRPYKKFWLLIFSTVVPLSTLQVPRYYRNSRLIFYDNVYSNLDISDIIQNRH